MVQSMTETPNASRMHIGIFGRRNNGKSSLINALTGQNTALVSKVAGTTTDPVYKTMELYPIGPCVLIDTAGFDDDQEELGSMRVQKSKELLEKTDLMLLVVAKGQKDVSLEKEWIQAAQQLKKPVIVVVNKMDEEGPQPDSFGKLPTVQVSALNKEGIDGLKEAIVKAAPQDFELSSLTGHLVKEGDHVLLVAPQDQQAPKGRLILPQVQTIRDLLDQQTVITITTPEKMPEALHQMKHPPELVITDSQVFPFVHEHCPKESKLTSFSVLMARYKGDIEEFIKGAEKIPKLRPGDRVLILEACAHNPMDGDIGREKIPKLLMKKAGGPLEIDVRAGNNIPEDLSSYQLVVHCGGCMFNRTHVLSRIARCKSQGVSITNYGIAIAKMSGILDKIVI